HNMGKKQEAIKYLEASQQAAQKLIESGRYGITSKYHDLFASIDLSGLVGNGGIIMYRKYDTGSSTNSMISFSSYEAQTGLSKDAMDAYLLDDGLPIGLSPKYKGDKSVKDY